MATDVEGRKQDQYACARHPRHNDAINRETRCKLLSSKESGTAGISQRSTIDAEETHNAPATTAGHKNVILYAGGEKNNDSA